MKEWQRTPAQLVQEYCQKQKRPKPLFQNQHAPQGQFVYFIFCCVYLQYSCGFARSKE